MRGPPPGRPRGGLFQDDVGVGAAEAEGGHPGPSSSASNSGKSTTHRKCSPPSVTGGRPRSSRKAPNTDCTIERFPATIRIRSPATAPRSSTIASCSASERNFATGDSSTPPSRTRIHTRPCAPNDFAALGQRVELRTGHVSLTGNADRLDRVGAGEGAEVGVAEDVGQLGQLHPEAHVGLVGAVTLHRLVPGHPRDRRRSLARTRGFRGGQHCDRDRVEHVGLVGEGHLDVELHELELPVGAQVFVAQAARDLEVAVEATDHQQLLEQLRALRQRIERAGPQARRHDEVARAFRRRRDQHRGLDLDEVLRRHRLAHRAVHARTQAQVALHRRAPEVEIAVPQAEHLVDVDAVVERERDGLRLRRALRSRMRSPRPRRSAGRR